MIDIQIPFWVGIVAIILEAVYAVILAYLEDYINENIVWKLQKPWECLAWIIIVTQTLIGIIIGILIVITIIIIVITFGVDWVPNVLHQLIETFRLHITVVE